MDEQETDFQKRQGSIGKFDLIDKVWQWRWSLRLTILVLYVDSIFLLRDGTGILESSLSPTDLFDDLGFFLVALALFGISVSLIVPAASYLMASLLCFLPTQDAKKYFDRPYGAVRASKFRDIALERKCDFMMREYIRHQNERKAITHTLSEVGQLTTGVLMLALFDMALPEFGFGESSIILNIFSLLGPAAHFLSFLVISCIAVVLKIAWLPEYDDWIHYPSLAKELDQDE